MIENDCIAVHFYYVCLDCSLTVDDHNIHFCPWNSVSKSTRIISSVSQKKPRSCVTDLGYRLFSKVNTGVGLHWKRVGLHSSFLHFTHFNPFLTNIEFLYHYIKLLNFLILSWGKTFNFRNKCMDINLTSFIMVVYKIWC